MKYVILRQNKDTKAVSAMASKDRYKFDSKIHVYRAARRMTQQELADLVGVSRQTIIAIENDKYNPTLELAMKLARHLGTTVEELFQLEV